MTTIYLIRHAEAEGNLYRVVQGQANSNLTDRGWRQVRALEQRFADIHIDAVYSSDLYRTCATASAIYKAKSLLLQRRQDLREIYVGSWEHRTWGDIYRTEPEQMDNFSRHLERWSVFGAETPIQVRERILNAIREIASENDGKTVAVFSHGYAIRLLLATLQGYSLEQVGQTPHGDNTAVSCIEVDGEAMHVVFRDDNSHLMTPEFLAKEKVRKRANALEPGLWFASLSLKRQKELFVNLARQARQDSGEPEAFDEPRLLADAAERTTLIGYRRNEPVGMIQMGPEKEWISGVYIREDFRKQGFGTQLIGQAVLFARARGGERLLAAMRPDAVAMPFFLDNGFTRLESLENGQVILEKDICFNPEFLSHDNI